MKYIDKSVNQTDGKAIVDELLTDSWNIDTYNGADYDALKKPKYKGRITNLLLTEQASNCCYCMKEIELPKTTIEHIIPQEVRIADFAEYLVVNELINNVIHKETFDKNSRIIPPSKYPHDIAYHNLIASCDSNLHCNNYRSNKNIKPLVFNPKIYEIVKYDKAGNIDCDQYEEDFNKIGLSNPASPLNLIRRIWFRLAEGFDQINQINEEIIDDIILDFILLSDGTKVIENFTNKPSYKDEVLKYSWFFLYYKNNK